MEFDRAESYITSFTVSLKVKPETPKLRFHPNLIEGENLRSHACTGEVGHPPGKLEIEIKRPGDTEFSTYHPAGQERIYSEVVGNCSSIQTLDFSIDLSSDSWNNVTARCIALNAVALNSTEIPPSSKEYTISSLAADFCSNKTSTYFEHHPMGCPFYVWCITGKPYGMECSTKSLCINTKTGSCS
ncbi:uncharacterized protein LOC134264347 [Saccostrea cucullata]|uniref:uncharacterized protein LOC134264347 n=1 Tax=Saccostrea cuccullata TaxID=36930 RepID=UPI002ED2A76A